MVKPIGRVTAIYRYPVKSMGGKSLRSATLRWQGIDGDRQYGFFRAADTSRFPWLTGRDVSPLVTYSARYIEPGNPRHSRVAVTIADEEYEVGDARLRQYLSNAAGEEIRLIQIGRGIFDAMPVSIISTTTLPLIEAQSGRAIDVRRFRANIVIEPTGSEDRETAWIGAVLAFGDSANAAKLTANVAIDRCAMITIDPDTATRDPAILRRVVQDFNNEVGVRCATEVPGTITVGDAVYLIAQ
jgi:uncharacterized protein YcbX